MAQFFPMKKVKGEDPTGEPFRHWSKREIRI